MKLVWNKYGKAEIPYTIDNLRSTLKEYAGASFSDAFFDNHIYKSKMPDYKTLFESVGVSLTQDANKPYFGASVSIKDGKGTITRNTQKGSPAYIAGLVKGDVITAMNNRPLVGEKINDFLNDHAPGDKVKVSYTRFGEERSTTLLLASDPAYKIELAEKNGKVDKKTLKKRAAWLNPK